MLKWPNCVFLHELRSQNLIFISPGPREEHRNTQVARLRRSSVPSAPPGQNIVMHSLDFTTQKSTCSSQLHNAALEPIALSRRRWPAGRIPALFCHRLAASLSIDFWRFYLGLFVRFVNPQESVICRSRSSFKTLQVILKSLHMNTMGDVIFKNTVFWIRILFCKTNQMKWTLNIC